MINKDIEELFNIHSIENIENFLTEIKEGEVLTQQINPNRKDYEEYLDVRKGKVICGV
jgi:hypothetical protein